MRGTSDACPFHDGGEQLALVGELAAAGEGLDELVDDGGSLVGPGIPSFVEQPLAHRAGALEAGSIDERVEHAAVDAHGVMFAAPGGAGIGGDLDSVVLGKRGDDAALALVGRADYGENRFRHAAP